MLDREYFYDAYDAVLDPVNIDFFIAHFNLRSDKKLRKMIKKAEPKAHENFLALRKFFFRKHITRTFTFCLFLGVLFFYFYLYYLIGLLLAIFAFTGYLRFVKGYQLGFFERLAIISVLAPHK